MAECLILGLTGAGKSSVVTELRSRGRLAYDADLVPGLGGWFGPDGQPSGYSSDPAWRASHQFLWDMSVVRRLLDERDDSQTLYLGGIAANALDAVPFFGNVVALDADVDTLCQRIAAPSRQTPHPFDCTDQYRMQLNEDISRFRKDMLYLGATIINAELDAPQVANNLIAAVEG
jgi:shikimate kinase